MLLLGRLKTLLSANVIVCLVCVKSNRETLYPSLISYTVEVITLFKLFLLLCSSPRNLCFALRLKVRTSCDTQQPVQHIGGTKFKSKGVWHCLVSIRKRKGFERS